MRVGYDLAKISTYPTSASGTDNRLIKNDQNISIIFLILVCQKKKKKKKKNRNDYVQVTSGLVMV